MPILNRSNWRVHYFWSTSSGLRLGNCDYMGVRVIHAASIPFVYVNYAGSKAGPFTDRLGTDRRRVEQREIVEGFDLRIRYDWYGEDYQYEHVWRFHSDGQFGTTVIIHGPGEEIEGRHTYHLPFRFDLDVSGSGADSFQKRSNGQWADIAREGRHDSVIAPEYEWRLADETTGRRVEMRARAGDDAELWALQYKHEESWASWGGANSGVPGSPGSVPAVYDTNQNVQDTNVVLWYIAHISSVDRISTCGPWFRLSGFPQPPADAADREHDHAHHHGGDH